MIPVSLPWLITCVTHFSIFGIVVCWTATTSLFFYYCQYLSKLQSFWLCLFFFKFFFFKLHILLFTTVKKLEIVLYLQPLPCYLPLTDKRRYRIDYGRLFFFVPFLMWSVAKFPALLHAVEDFCAASVSSSSVSSRPNQSTCMIYEFIVSPDRC